MINGRASRYASLNGAALSWIVARSADGLGLSWEPLCYKSLHCCGYQGMARAEKFLHKYIIRQSDDP